MLDNSSNQSVRESTQCVSVEIHKLSRILSTYANFRISKFECTPLNLRHISAYTYILDILSVLFDSELKSKLAVRVNPSEPYTHYDSKAQCENTSKPSK